MIIKNIDVFLKWLYLNIRQENFVADFFVDDLESQVAFTGNPYYELSKQFTKSGQAELIYFDLSVGVLKGESYQIIEF